MEYKIIITKEAKRTLKEINKYISFRFLECNIAKKLINKIKKSINNLKQSPYMYMEIKTKFNSKKYRRIVTKNYIILYRVNEKEKIIYINRIIHSRRDYLRDQIAKYMLQGTGVFI